MSGDRATEVLHVSYLGDDWVRVRDVVLWLTESADDRERNRPNRDVVSSFRCGEAQGRINALRDVAAHLPKPVEDPPEEPQ